jgi:Tol biopolymer transport system component/PKD repeat protein
MKRLTLIRWGVIALVCCLLLVLPAGAVSNGKIACNMLGAIVSMNPDGTGIKTVAGGSNPAYSPDGTRIAFDKNGEIYVANADGSTPIDITNNPANDYSPIWSPDGKKIAFTSDRDTSSPNNIYIMDSKDGGNLEETSGGGIPGSWSPDGNKIACTKIDNVIIGGAPMGYLQRIYILDLATGQYYIDADLHQNEFSSNPADYNSPAWSPDGTSLVYNGKEYDYNHREIMKDGGRLTSGDLGGNNIDPAWSPDGSKIVFSSDRTGTDHLFILNLADGKQTQIPYIGSYCIDPTWAINVKSVADAGPDQTVFVDETVTFDGSKSSDPDGNIVSYAWDYGDGTSGSGVSATHTYAATGVYTATLTVTDNGGLTASDTAAINVVSPVAITYPSGGEIFATGYTGGFYWTSTNVNENLKVTLKKDKTTIKTWTEAQPSGEETFAVPGEWGTGDNYKFCIQGTVHPEYQSCNGTFTITNPITVISPNGGEYWPPGSKQTIQWSSNVCSGPLAVHCLPALSKVDVQVIEGSSSTIVKDFGENDLNGQIPWTVDIPKGTDYKVKVSSVANPAVYDTSDWWFYVEDDTNCIHLGGKTICMGTPFVDLSAIARGSSCPPICPTIDIFKIHYSATGAVNIPLTTGAGDAAFPIIDKEGLTTITYYTEDSLGNLGTPQTYVIMVDRTPPTITGSASPKANANGWNNQDVKVTFTCTDSLSGIKSCTPLTTLTKDGAGLSVKGEAVDNAGNIADVTVKGINIDKTPPQITITVPANGASYFQNDVKRALWSVKEVLSGIATKSGTVASGAVIDTKTAGKKVFTVTAKDKAGNAATLTNNYDVLIPTKTKIVPNSLNIGRKGYFIAFVTLPKPYNAADVDAKSVVCNGASAEKLIRGKMFPQMFIAIFSRDKLVNVKPGDKVVLSVTGTITKNGQKLGFSGSDSVKVINKASKVKEDTDDVMKMTDDKIVTQFS